jgi:hypothetical protein
VRDPDQGVLLGERDADVALLRILRVLGSMLWIILKVFPAKKMEKKFAIVTQNNYI